MRRLAAAARAAWWTFLIGVGLALVQFLGYCAISHCELLWSCLSRLINMEPEDANDLALRFIVAVRLILIIVAIGAIFLSLWVHRLRRVGDA